MRRSLATLVGLLCLMVPASATAAERDWIRKALGLQYELASDVELRNAPWVYTHNSYNSEAEMGPTLSNRDPNQALTIVDQLDEGVRSLEIDTHLFVSPQAGGRGPVVCHARGEQEGHAGCTAEKPLLTVLAEVRAWMNRNPREVLLLYLESHLDSPEGYAAGTEAIERTLGSRVYRPRSRGRRCDDLPLRLTRDQVRRAGKQAILMGPCGEGNRWQGYVHDEEERKTGSDNAPFRDYPDCGSDFTRLEYEQKVIRYYEDATQLSRTTSLGVDPITPALAGRMIRCGVDLIGLDFLARGDPRLEAMVWSWAPGQPAGAGRCSIQRSDGRWEARPCVQRARVACRKKNGLWFVPRARVKARSAPRVCKSRKYVNGVPRTGVEGQVLRSAMRPRGAKTVWLGQRRRGASWVRFEKRGCGPSLGRRRARVREGVARFVVRLRFACTRERLRGRRRVVVTGGLRRVRTRAGRVTRVRVGRSTRRLEVRFRYEGKRRSLTLRLRR